MNPEIYREMTRTEDRHWWFRGRRRIIRHMLCKAALPPGAVILDAGSGTGGNCALLGEFGTVYAMEMDEAARVMANQRGGVEVHEGMLPHAIPFAPQCFHMAVMFDVLEHVDKDYDALVALHHRLMPDGKLLLTVPAFPFLWSEHDVVHHHKRRYTLPALIRLVESAGYRVKFANYINFWLFPLIAAVRVLNRVSGNRFIAKHSDENAELSIPPSFLNRLLEDIFASEAYLADRLRLPFGVSIMLLAQKRT